MAGQTDDESTSSDSSHLADDPVAVAAHELRGPIGGIRSFLSLLVEGKFGSLTGKGSQYAQEALEQTERLNDLVRTFVAASHGDPSDEQ